MLQEKSKTIKNYFEIQSTEDFLSFLQQNFQLSTHEGVEIEKNIILNAINKEPYRQSPEYLKFLARVLFMAAEFGYPRLTWVTGGFIRERNSKDEIIDVFDPRFLVWLAYLLANNTLRLWEQKIDLLRMHIKDSDAVFYELLGASENPVGGAIQLSAKSLDRRKEESLPSYIPDFKFLRSILNLEKAIDSRILNNPNIEFKDRKAQYIKDTEFLTQQEFFAIYMPILRESFVNIDLDKVFMSI